jgi:lysophospholipase L1-like esterase
MQSLVLKTACLSLLLLPLSMRSVNATDAGLAVAAKQIAVAQSVASSATAAVSPSSNAPQHPLEVQDSTKPIPRRDSRWVDLHLELVSRAEKGGVDLAFIGDSITELMDRSTVRQVFGDKAETFGIGGDRTQHLLWRFQHDELKFPKEQQPKAAVILIGTNNLSDWLDIQPSTDDETARGIESDIDEFTKQLPETKLIVLGLLPRGEKADDTMRPHVRAVNAELKKDLAGRNNVYYYDIGKIFTKHDGTISTSIMKDFLHPTQAGYKLMFDAIKPHVNVAMEH